MVTLPLNPLPAAGSVEKDEPMSKEAQDAPVDAVVMQRIQHWLNTWELA